MERYDERVALVTGATRGLGRHIALELAKAGCDVALTARSPEPLAALANEIAEETGRRTLAIPADVTVHQDRVGVCDQVQHRLGPVDILANVAAIARATRFVDEDPTRILATNLEAPVHLTRLVLEGMTQRGFGRILNVGSLAGKAGLPYVVDYSASKAGLIAFSVALREELHGSGVSVTVVSPGFIIDEGMYVAYRTPIPWYLGTNHSAVIAKNAVRALRKNRAEVVLNRMPLRPLLALGAISETVMRSVTRALGVTSYLRGLAEKRLPYSDASDLIRREGAA